MPIKATSNDKGIWITWETPDEGISTTFRLMKKDSDEEILSKLFRLTRFISAQMGELNSEIAELELEIRGSDAAAALPHSAAQGPAPSASSEPAATVPPNATRILMPPPGSLSDLPNGGPPVSTFGWGSMPTTSVPSSLADPKNGGWEMIPPEEME